MKAVPTVYGISALQRQSRSILDQAKTQPVFLTERNKVSYVVLDATSFEALANESSFWLAAQSASAEAVWGDASNDAYNAL